MARFYAACLASYNAGRLHGAWIELSTDTDEMGEAVQEMLKASPARGAEEWAVHDYDGVPSSLGEYPGLEGLAQAAEILEAAEVQIGDEDLAREVAKAALDNFHGDHEHAMSAVQEDYQGHFDSLVAWADNYLEQAGILERIPEDLRSYFDSESWARDQQLGGAIWTARGETGLHVFSSN